MLKRPHYIALGVVALLALILLSLPNHAAGQIKVAIGSLFLPLFGLSRSGQQLTHKVGDATTSRAELLRENDLLRRTNQFLRLRIAADETRQRENDQLRQLAGLRRQLPWTGRLTRVIARSPDNWWQMVHIDLGKRDGPEIKEDLPVLTPDGKLIGRIASVGLTTSEVILIGSPVCKVSVAIEKTGETGVIAGGVGPLDNTLATLTFLPTKSQSKPGLTVRTSNLGDIFPPGIVIGTLVENPHTVDDGYAEARVKLAADLSALDYVFVLTK